MADASEPFLFTRLIEALRVAEDACRGLAISREDRRWIRVAGIIGNINANAKDLAHKSAHQALKIIGREMTRQ